MAHAWAAACTLCRCIAHAMRCSSKVRAQARVSFNHKTVPVLYTVAIFAGECSKAYFLVLWGLCAACCSADCKQTLPRQHSVPCDCGTPTASAQPLCSTSQATAQINSSLA